MLPSGSRHRASGAHKRWKRSAALAMLAAASVPAFAAGAHASIAPGAVSGTLTPQGQVVLDTVPFGLTGTPDGISDVSFTGADAQFTWFRGTVGAHLTGTLHVDGGQNARFRVRVDSLTGNNDVLDTAYDKDKGSAIKTASQDVPVDMAAVAAPNLVKARIVLEEQGASAKWKSRGEYYAQVVPHTDDVTILGKSLDVGGLSFDKGDPTTPAGVSWAVGDDGALSATYRGYLHFKNFAGSARVVLRAIDPITGSATATTEGETHSSAGDGHEVAPGGGVPETLTVSSSSASSIQVAMQSWVSGPGAGGGSWQDVNSQTVSAAE